MFRYIIFLLFPLMIFGQNQVKDITALFEKEDFQSALRLAKNYAKNNSNNLEAIELLGDAYSYLKQWDHAIETYEALIVFKPNNANYYYKYGGALAMKAKSVNKIKALVIIGDIEEAFLKAVQLDSKHIEARWGLVHYYLHVPKIVGGSNTKAMQYAQELYALSQVDGYLAIGHVHQNKREFELAETHYKQAVAIGRSKTCYTHLVDLYVDFKKYQLAIDTLQEAYDNLQDPEFLDRITQVKTEMD